METIRKITLSKTYIKDFKKLRMGPYKSVLENELDHIVSDLANNIPLAIKHHDHALSGKLRQFRECHIKPDLLLLYALPTNESLYLVRLGTHSELFK